MKYADKNRFLLRNNNPNVPWPSCSVTIQLPAMDGRGALQIIEILGQIDRAIWRTHGERMADELGMYGIEWDAPSCRCAAQDITHEQRAKNIDF